PGGGARRVAAAAKSRARVGDRLRPLLSRCRAHLLHTGRGGRSNREGVSPSADDRRGAHESAQLGSERQLSDAWRMRAGCPHDVSRSIARVLARAAELQSADADPADAALNEDQLIEVAREVGLSPEHLKQALAEERSRAQVPEESGVAARLFGPAHVHASRTIKGTAAATLERLDTWLQREESMQVKRRLFDRMLWEPRPGLFSEMRRLLNVSGRGYYLRPTREVGATVVPVDP